MNCDECARWFDRGEGDAAAAHAHIASCARCRAQERAAYRIEELLGRQAIEAPAGFAARVVARIATEPVAVAAVPWRASPLPLWVRVVSQPNCVLASVLAGAIGVGAAFDAAPFAALRTFLAAAPGAAALRELCGDLAASPLFATERLQLGVAVGALPLVALVGIALYGASRRWCVQGRSRSGW